MPNMPITAEGIGKYLSTPMKVTVYDEIDSTNTAARRQFLAGASFPALFVANGQTAGRGRQGKSFYSPSGSGLYLSLLLPAKCAYDAVPITTLAAVGVARAVESVGGVSCGIKWVNDLYVGGKKVAGLLAEAIPSLQGVGAVVMGVGINIWTNDFPTELVEAGALLSGNALPDDDFRNRLAAAVAEEVFHAIGAEDKGAWMEEYRRRSCVLGKRVYFLQNGKRSEGLAHGITEQGGLCVRLDNGEDCILTSGEITLRAIE